MTPEELADFKPRYFIIWTCRYANSDGTYMQKVHAAFTDPGPVACYLEALRPQDRPDFHAVDAAGHEIEMIGHRDDWYSHGSALLPGAKMWHPKDEMEKRGWKFTNAQKGTRP